ALRPAVDTLDAALGDEPGGEAEDRDSDRDVDGEDPRPAEVLDYEPAQEHAGRSAAACDAAPDPERLVPLGSAVPARGADDRERGGGDDGRTETLVGAEEDQGRSAARERAGERAGR